MAVHTIPLCLFAWPHQDFMRCPRTPELHEGISLDTGYQLSLSWPEVYTRRESNPRPGKISVLTPLCHLSYACAPEGLSICTPDIRSDPFETHCSLSIRGSTCLRKCWGSAGYATGSPTEQFPFPLGYNQYSCTHWTVILVCLATPGLVRCPRSPSLLCWA